MKKTITLSLLSFLFAFVAFAQERACATMEDLEHRKQLDPKLESRMQAIEDYTKVKVQEFEQLAGQQNKIVGDIITIPVVVHVLYRNSTENISDAQIQSQLDVLNEDFRRTNPDADNVWSQAADTQIEFCLSTIDPNGNATTGITRKSTTRRNWGTGNDMKRTSTGGIAPWDTSEYLNMWVVPQMLNSQGGTILGYAQFPGGAASTDGVVMGYNYFGRIGAVSAPFDGGRTTTHEIGHFLNLRHIWGDSNCGNDFVSDTPTHQTSNSGCPAGRTSCGSVDMYQNYMDYSNDVCMNLFTTGQKNRMRAVLAAGGFRRSLALSDKCGSVAQPTCNDGVQNGDETGVDCGGSCAPCQTGNQYCASNGNSTSDEYIGRVQIGTINKTSGVGSTSTGYSDFTSTSTDLSAGGTSTITITPTWTGTLYNEGYAVFIDYNQNGDFTDSGETVWTRAASQTTPVSGSFTVPSSAVSGTTRMRVSMKYNGVPTSCESFQYGEVEDYTVNITTGGGNTGCVGGESAPYGEGFESSIGLWTQASGDDLNWTRDSGGTPSNGTGPSSGSQGSNYIYVEASGNGTGYPNKRAIINSPCLNLNNASSATFTFDYHMYGSTNGGRVDLEASDDNGTTWTSIWNQTGNQGNQWNSVSVNLSAYVGGGLQLRFNRITGGTWQSDVAIDNINLSAASALNTLAATVKEVTVNDFNIKIYPNPVKGNLLNVSTFADNIDYRIYNTLGQVVAKGQLTTNSINVSELEAAVYLVEFSNENTKITKRFIKQ